MYVMQRPHVLKDKKLWQEYMNVYLLHQSRKTKSPKNYPHEKAEILQVCEVDINAMWFQPASIIDEVGFFFPSNIINRSQFKRLDWKIYLLIPSHPSPEIAKMLALLLKLANVRIAYARKATYRDSVTKLSLFSCE